MNEIPPRHPIRPSDPVPTRVLVVDDGITMRLFYRMILEGAGFSVEEASNGLEGYEKALTRSFDLLIVDINMPKLDGYSMMRLVRANPLIRHVPAMIVSTEAGENDRQQAYAAGANAYVVKPAVPEKLIQMARLMSGVVDS